MKSYGTKRPNNKKAPKTLLYAGQQHEVVRVDNSRGVYVLRSKSNPSEEIEVPFSDYVPTSRGSGS